MDFNISWGSPHDGTTTSSIGAGYGDKIDPLQAKGNMSYLQFIDRMADYIANAHPEWQFTPFADNNIYNPEMGYIIYSLVDRVTKENHTKPRIHYIDNHPLYPDKNLAVFIQSFINTVKFTAVHPNPRIAEAMIEEFQNFMYGVTYMLKEDGLDECIFGRRAADEHKTRYGEDLPARSVIYIVTEQKILPVDIDKLNQVYIEVSAPRVDNTPEAATPNTGEIFVNMYDTHATPSTSL